MPDRRINKQYKTPASFIYRHTCFLKFDYDDMIINCLYMSSSIQSVIIGLYQFFALAIKKEYNSFRLLKKPDIYSWITINRVHISNNTSFTCAGLWFPKGLSLFYIRKYIFLLTFRTKNFLQWPIYFHALYYLRWYAWLHLQCRHKNTGITNGASITFASPCQWF